MDKNQVIEELYKHKIIEQIVYQVGRGEDLQNLEDCIQDLYVALLEKPNKLIISMYENKEINFYIANMAVRQIRSKTSPYFQKYKKFRNSSKPIIDSLLKTEE